MTATASDSTALLEAHTALLSRIGRNRTLRSDVLKPTAHSLPAWGEAARRPPPSPPAPTARLDISHIPEAKRRKYEAYYPNYAWDEETIRNDIPARYLSANEWGGNAIYGADEEKRCEEYPRQRKLLALKRAQIDLVSHGPLFLPLPAAAVKGSAASFALGPVPAPPPSPPAAPGAAATIVVPGLPPTLTPLASHLIDNLSPHRFDSILITPPPSMTWPEISSLPIRQLSADPAFVFLWVGQGNEDGLEKGKETMFKWGFRRCEEICWIKTNFNKDKRKEDGKSGGDPPTDSIFQNTKEHLLMGIRGTVRRAHDGHFVHTNIDTDVIVWEGDFEDKLQKPAEMYTLIENFCLGTRRLELFGCESKARRGWVTAGHPEPSSSKTTSTSTSRPSTIVGALEAMVEDKAEELTKTIAKPHGLPPRPAFQTLTDRFDKKTYDALVTIDGRHVVPVPSEIEILRPKSANKGRPHSSLGPGGGGGAGNATSSRPSGVSAGLATVTVGGSGFAGGGGGGFLHVGGGGMAEMHHQQQQMAAMMAAASGGMYFPQDAGMMMGGMGGMSGMGGMGGMGGIGGMGMGMPPGMGMGMSGMGMQMPEMGMHMPEMGMGVGMSGMGGLELGMPMPMGGGMGMGMGGFGGSSTGNGSQPQQQFYPQHQHHQHQAGGGLGVGIGVGVGDPFAGVGGDGLSQPKAGKSPSPLPQQQQQRPMSTLQQQQAQLAALQQQQMMMNQMMMGQYPGSFGGGFGGGAF